MKPNFTLFLSADGLRLLHRSGSGWQLVGTANVSSPTLAGDLDVLRKTAAGLEPQGLRCRLILPNDQIRYLSINANGLDTGDCRAAVMKALDGVTPYRLEDLVIDFTLDRTQCHMAAVARETLEEAEQFALAYGFTPVCFAALPHDPIFAWEPSFGVTQHAKEASLEVDLVDPPYVEASTNRIEQTETPVSEAPVATPAEPLFRTRRSAAPAARAGQKRPEFSPRADAQTEDYAVAGFAAPQKPFAPRRRPGPAVQETPRPTVRLPEAAPTKPRKKKPAPATEAERLTVFGARGTEEGPSKPVLDKRLLMAAMVFAAICVGGWAVGITPARIVMAVAPGLQVSSTPPEAQFASPIQPPEPVAKAPEEPQAVLPKVLPTRATLTDEDSAVLDALSSPLLAEPDITTPFAPDPARTQYAVTGIWIEAPRVPTPPAATGLDDLYVTSIDPVKTTRDAVALPDVSKQIQDVSLPIPSSPAAPGTRFSLDDRGLVSPSADGTMNPDGIPVFAGPPPAQPPAEVLEPAVADVDERFAGLAELRPRERPGDLQEQTERANFAGLTRSELAEYRPRLRPQSEQERANASATAGSAAQAASLASTGTPQATASSLRPDARPANFSQIVAASRGSIGSVASAAATATVRTASVAPRRVAPPIPSTASTSREATVENAINLRRVNLIGVYGKPSDRRAVVRLSNGRFQNVRVGDKIDGGRISAIGDAELRYQKSGRNHVLKMPSG